MECMAVIILENYLLTNKNVIATGKQILKLVFIHNDLSTCCALFDFVMDGHSTYLFFQLSSNPPKYYLKILV